MVVPDRGEPSTKIGLAQTRTSSKSGRPAVGCPSGTGYCLREHGRSRDAWRDNHATHSLEMSQPVAPVGLEVVSLRPFVPGIQEDEAIVEGPAGGRSDCAAQRLLEGFRRRVYEHNTVLAAPRRVVPTHEHGPVDGEVPRAPPLAPGLGVFDH